MSDLQNEKEQEKELLTQKIESYLASLYRIAFLQLKNAEDAEDVVQEVFCQYIKTDKIFENEEHEKAWLIKVTLNYCKKIWRSAWYRHKASLPETETFDWNTEEERLENEYIHKEENAELMRAVWELPDKYREVIHLFYYEELSVKEIAAICGRQESTVTSQLTRGRNILKKRLKEDYQFEGFQGSI
ncbi:MAG: RNA polymerase sigma factor [Lachnospiraceae bacterium]